MNAKYCALMNSNWSTDNLQLLLRQMHQKNLRLRQAHPYRTAVEASGWQANAAADAFSIAPAPRERICNRWKILKRPFFSDSCAGGSALLQSDSDRTQHIASGSGFARPNLKLAGSLVNEHLYPGNDREPLRPRHL